MHLHNVYFWLFNDLDGAAVAAFEQGLSALCGDANVHKGLFGKPAATSRDVVDSSYSYGMVLIFDDLAAHDRYQVGNVHQKFVAENLPKWTRVQVYDIETS